MKCREVKGQLSPYLDGVLDQAVREEIINHLEACPGCLEDLRALGKALNMLRALPPVEPPVNFCETVLHKISKNPGKRKIAVRPWSGMVAMAAAICLVVGVTAFFYGSPLQWGTKSLLQKSLLDGITVTATDDSGHPGSVPVAPDNSGALPDPGGQASDLKTAQVSGGPAGPSGSKDIPGIVAPGTTAVSTGTAGVTGGGSPQIQAFAQQGINLDRTPAANSGRAFIASLPVGSQTIASREFAVSRQAAFGSVKASLSERQKAIRSATLAVEADPAGFSATAAAIAQSNGGGIQPGWEGKGFMAMRVPASRFDQVINSLRESGPVNLINISRDDVTEQYLDVESKIRSLSEEEQRLITASNLAATEEEREAAGVKLASVRQGLDQQKKAFDELAGKVEFATINIGYK